VHLSHRAHLILAGEVMKHETGEHPVKGSIRIG
jgi:hypothetical protein